MKEMHIIYCTHHLNLLLMPLQHARDDYKHHGGSETVKEESDASEKNYCPALKVIGGNSQAQFL
jgi:hypothetical protein